MTDAEKLWYDAGYDCAKNGANLGNCHFNLFATPALTKAWEDGKRAAEVAIDNEDDPRFPPEECLDAKHPDDPRHGQAQGINKGAGR